MDTFQKVNHDYLVGHIKTTKICSLVAENLFFYFLDQWISELLIKCHFNSVPNYYFPFCQSSPVFSLVGTIVLTQQKDSLLQLIYSFLLVCHKFLSVVLAEVRFYSILLSAVSLSACYPSNSVLILTSAPPNTRCYGREPVGKLFSFLTLTFTDSLIFIVRLSSSTWLSQSLTLFLSSSLIISALLCYTVHPFFPSSASLPLFCLLPPLNFSFCLFSVCEEVLGKARVDILGIYLPCLGYTASLNVV